MADFFSQFQVHPGTPTSSPTQDFNLGGFQPASDQTPYYDPNNLAPGIKPYGQDNGPIQGFNDPKVSVLPQPYQQGPGGTGPVVGGLMPDGSFNANPYNYDKSQGPFIPNSQLGIDPNAGHLMGGTLGQMGPIQQQMAQNGGFYAPPAVNMGANGPQQVPMNPSQQSGALGSPMVQMTGPDGSQQFVDPQHVQHYTGLGAQVTGQQLAGMSGSSYGGG